MYLDARQAKALAKISEETKIPKSVLIRDALNIVIKTHRKKSRRRP